MLVNEVYHPTIIHALLDWCERTPDAIALTDGDIELSYERLTQHVEAASRRLVGLGVRRHDRVIVVGNNTWQWVVCYLATMRIGAISVPMNNRLAPVQVDELVKLLGSKVALADDAHLAMFDDCSDLGVFSISAADGPQAFFSLAALGGLDNLPEATEDALISFTSGTTGVPKGAVITHNALRKAVQIYADLLGGSPSNSTLKIPRSKPV